MKDWSWEGHESGNQLALMLDLDADFSAGSEHQRWFSGLELKHYRLYEGPFNEKLYQADQMVCAFFEKGLYEKLVKLYSDLEPIGYGVYHYVLLKRSRLEFIRAWGDTETKASDATILRLLLKRGVEIRDWAIQDWDFGNYWAQGSGTESFRAYLAD